MLAPLVAFAVGASLAGPSLALDTGRSEVPRSLQDARRLNDDLRYEEAIVEYQRYLAGNPNRPVSERAKALLELGFLHLILEDQLSAERRSIEALDLDPNVRLPASAPAKQLAFIAALRARLAERIRLEVLRDETAAPHDVQVQLTDPQGRARRVLLRHALSPTGPFYASPMRCGRDKCRGTIPPPSSGSSFMVWYYAEALDQGGETLAQAASPNAPLQLAVIGHDAWYSRPLVWGAGGVALIAVAAVVYLISPAPPR